MGFKLGKLSAARVGTLVHPGRYGDGGGLWLQVSKGATKAWLFRYTYGGKARQMGLGPVHTITLAEAREKAREARKLLLDGKDPLADKAVRTGAAKLAAAKSLTFRHFAEQYIKDHEDTWRHPKHRQQWPNSLSAYVYPIIGALPVAGIDKGLVLQ